MVIQTKLICVLSDHNQILLQISNYLIDIICTLNKIGHLIFTINSIKCFNYLQLSRCKNVRYVSNDEPCNASIDERGRDRDRDRDRK